MRLYIVITVFNIISDSAWWRILCSGLVLLRLQGMTRRKLREATRRSLYALIY